MCLGFAWDHWRKQGCKLIMNDQMGKWYHWMDNFYIGWQYTNLLFGEISMLYIFPKVAGLKSQ